MILLKLTNVFYPNELTFTNWEKYLAYAQKQAKPITGLLVNTFED